MIRRPPRTTRTDTLFPDTTLFRSGDCRRSALCAGWLAVSPDGPDDRGALHRYGWSIGPCVRPHALLRLPLRSEEHTSELQSLMRISYAVFCLKQKTTNKHRTPYLLSNTHKTY